MSDSDAIPDILERMQHREAAQREQARQTLAVTCDRLSELGVTLVDITYDGYGDSGAIESVRAFAGDKETKLPDDVDEALQDVACELLPGGWEINDGSFGELVLDVAGRKITRQHNWRSTEYDEEELDL
jgi:hypothetical protein